MDEPLGKNSMEREEIQPEKAEPGTPHPFEELLDDYPLRDPAEDPVWSVRIVKVWAWFMAFSIAGIVLLLILGLFYD